MHGAYSVKMVVIFLISYEFIPNAHADNFRILDTNMYSWSLENTGPPPVPTQTTLKTSLKARMVHSMQIRSMLLNTCSSKSSDGHLRIIVGS